jgi:hypothetical protein
MVVQSNAECKMVNFTNTIETKVTECEHFDISYSGNSCTNWIFLGRNVDQTSQCSIVWISLIPTQIKNTNTPTANQGAEAP